MKKSIWIVVLVIVFLILLGLFLSRDKEGESVDQSLIGTTHTTVGFIESVDTSLAMADGPVVLELEEQNGNILTIDVPTMGLNLCAGYPNIYGSFDLERGDRVEVKGTVVNENKIIPCESKEHYLRAYRFLEDQNLEVAFEYRLGPNGYIVQNAEFDATPSLGEPGFVSGYTLVLESDFNEMQAIEEPTEGPPSISLYTFDDPFNRTASTWADEFSEISGIDRAVGELSTNSKVGGLTALNFQSDGLFSNNIYIVSYDGSVYMFVGQYIDAESQMVVDFQDLINSVEFLQEASSSK